MIELNEALVEKIRTDTAASVAMLCGSALSAIDDGGAWNYENYRILSEVYAFLYAAQEAGFIDSDLCAPSLVGVMDRDEVCRIVQNWLQDLLAYYKLIFDQDKVENNKNQFRSMFGSIFSYEFSQGDVERVQLLVNELREHISKAGLEDAHKQRLLSRLEKLQSELHKKISDLDRFWGLVGDAGVVMGKLGVDAKPIVDRVKEIADIVWRTQGRAEELPSGAKFPLLEDKSKG